jgi:hypothetical protein
MKTIALICICAALLTCEAKEKENNFLVDLAFNYFNDIRETLKSQYLSSQDQQIQPVSDEASTLDSLTAQLQYLADELDLGNEELKDSLLEEIDAILSKVDAELNFSGGLA